MTHDQGSGIWFLFGYEECSQALRETEQLLGGSERPGGEAPRAGGLSMLRSDPPDHTRRIESTLR